MKFGSYSPDLPEWGHGGLVKAENAYFSPAGYRPIKAASAVTGALSYTWLGSLAFTGLDGTNVLLAGTTDGLYAYIASAWVKKYPAGAGSYAAAFNWAQFGDRVIAVAGAAPVKYTISTSTGAALGGTPPSSTMICIGGDHVFLAGDPSAVSTVYWSALNDSEGWTVGTSGAGKQLLPDGGKITGMSGGETVLVFQEYGIQLFERADAPTYWTRRKIAEQGALCPGGVCKVGRDTAYYSRNGFKIISEGQISPIGAVRYDAGGNPRGGVDNTFAATYSEAELQANLRCAFDEARDLIIWSMPDKLWIYHRQSGEWTTAYIPGLTGISTGKTVSTTLEAIAVTYPAIESVPGSLDDPIWQGGQPMLTFAKSDNIIYSFGSQTNLEATLRLAKQEITPGQWATVRAARVQTDATGYVTVNIDCYPRLGDSVTRKSGTTMQPNGEIPILATGHHLQAEVVMAAPATWTYCSGIDLTATPGGTR